MKLPIGALLAISMISCLAPYDHDRTDTIDIHVENQTGNDLQAVNVFVIQGTTVNGTYQYRHTDSSFIGTIADAKTAKGTLSEKNIPGVDGGYSVTVFDKSGKKRSYKFGYLSNGYFSEAAQYVTVKKDTIFARN